MHDGGRHRVGLDCGAADGNPGCAGAIVPDKAPNEISDEVSNDVSNDVPKIRTRRCYNFIYKKSWCRRTYAPSFLI